MAALQAFNPPLGPQPAGVLYAPQQVTLCMKEKVFSLTGDSFHVKTVDGADVMLVKGKHGSLPNLRMIKLTFAYSKNHQHPWKEGFHRLTGS